MKKSMIMVGGINLGILLVSFVGALINGAGQESAVLAGLVGFALTPINLLVGIIAIIFAGQDSAAKNYAYSFLICSSILLLCSLTLCSTA